MTSNFMILLNEFIAALDRHGPGLTKLGVTVGTDNHHNLMQYHGLSAELKSIETLECEKCKNLIKLITAPDKESLTKVGEHPVTSMLF